MSISDLFIEISGGRTIVKGKDFPFTVSSSSCAQGGHNSFFSSACFVLKEQRILY